MSEETEGSRYSQGLVFGAAVILDNGQSMTVDEIVGRLNGITDEIEAAHMAGQADAGVDPGFSNAQAYRIKVTE